MNPKVSIVIPVYGNEAFLPKCISTLRAQTLRDIEFIFVCDGSPDNSLAILRRAEKMDSRIRVIAFEENQGVSAARNAGIDAARVQVNTTSVVVLVHSRLVWAFGVVYDFSDVAHDE